MTDNRIAIRLLLAILLLLALALVLAGLAIEACR